MNCRIDWVVLVGVVLDGVVAGVREGIGMIGKVPYQVRYLSLPFFGSTLLWKGRDDQSY